jgi:hypothetical protein
MFLKAKYWKSAWADKVDAQVPATTAAVAVVPPAVRMPVAEAAVRQTSESADPPWLTESRWLQAEAEWAEATPMRKLEMAGAIRGALETVLMDREEAEPLRIQAAVAAHHGSDGTDRATTEAAEAWATEELGPQTLVTT